MQITHQEAHKLIQFHKDGALDQQAKAVLSTHLQQCTECRAYAQDINEVENVLLPVMKRKWNVQPIPLPVHAIATGKYSKIPAGAILATRTALISVLLITFIFSIWQFRISGRQSLTPLPANLPPVPTPSPQATTTRIMLQNCAETLYGVQENDTLESIAHQFSISKEEIMMNNNMKTEAVSPSMKLKIQVCGSTPTGTIDPVTLTTTYTPIVNPVTTTLGG